MARTNRSCPACYIRGHPFNPAACILDPVFEDGSGPQGAGRDAAGRSYSIIQEPWASPIVLVEKRDGSMHFCVNYQKVNKMSKFDAYLIHRAEEIFESIKPVKVISTHDLAKGYW